MVEADEQCFEIGMAGDIDAENFACEATVEALDHAIGLRGIGFGHAAGDFELRTGAFEIISGEAGSAIREHMGDAEGERLSRFCQESDRVGCIFRIVDGEVHKAGAAVDRDIQIALSYLTVGGPQLWRCLTSIWM